MFSLVERCFRGENDAWADLWLVYDHIAAQPVRRLLVRAGFDSSEANDVAIEVFERLWEKKCKRLRSFRGESEVELANWLIHVAMNFTRNWIDMRLRAMKRERRALKGLHSPDRTSPTEEEITALFQELDQIASSEDMNRLRKITGLSGSPPIQRILADATSGRPSERTERLWIKDLVEKLQKGDWTPRRRKQKHTPPQDQRPKKKTEEFLEFGCRWRGHYLSLVIVGPKVIAGDGKGDHRLGELVVRNNLMLRAIGCKLVSTAIEIGICVALMAGCGGPNDLLDLRSFHES